MNKNKKNMLKPIPTQIDQKRRQEEIQLNQKFDEKVTKLDI